MISMLVFVVGALLGVMLLRGCLRRITTWSRPLQVLVPVCFAILGVVPLISIRLGTVAPTGAKTVLAVGYFVLFTVVATVALNGKASRAETSTGRRGFV